MGKLNFYKHEILRHCCPCRCCSSRFPTSCWSRSRRHQPPERTTTTLRNSGRVTGPSTELPTQPTKTAPSPSPTTGRVPNNAPNPGNAEVPDSAREADGAPVMTDVREPHSQTKLQVSSQITDQ